MNGLRAIALVLMLVQCSAIALNMLVQILLPNVLICAFLQLCYKCCSTETVFLTFLINTHNFTFRFLELGTFFSLLHHVVGMKNLITNCNWEEKRKQFKLVLSSQLAFSSSELQTFTHSYCQTFWLETVRPTNLQTFKYLHLHPNFQLHFEFLITFAFTFKFALEFMLIFTFVGPKSKFNTNASVDHLQYCRAT